MCRRARCARQHRRAQLSPAAYEALEPTIYEQLTPFLGGITQSQVDKAISWFTDPGPPPKYADLKYNMTAATTLRADDPLYPYSNPYILKVVVKDGVFYLPGGRIAPIREGFAFTSQWSSGFLLLDLLNASDKYGPFPDMEFFVTSGDFQRLYHLSDDGTTFPLFSATGSKHFYDLVLPESPTTQYIRETPVSYKWSDRTDKVVGRFNLMCHRGGPSRPGRGQTEKHPCVRIKYHEIGQSKLNHDGILDVGIYENAPDGKNKAWLHPEDNARAKFALVLDGGTTADRLASVLRGGQLVMLEDDSPLFSHYYAALKPWKHYVPVGRESYDDIFDIARFLVKNDKLARRIAEEGQQFGHKYLTKEASECYTKKFLEVLSSLFTYKPRPLGPLAISLRDAIELVEADRIWMEQHPEPVQDEDPDES
ncbi:hypothetical protein WJX74_010503 [Apatococcus lobatus]|uniref:Glycosyl transferase CAP10 domain-containing protein n=1 Tax=Apatococcus lobatus TaxID=904363 RepID=A0AAW1SHS7_9CHLO